jgi:hypothetical protein
MLDVVCFLEQQLIYDRIGRFPGPQWPHRRDAYALYVLEALEREAPASRTQLWEATRGSQPTRNDPCACGGAAKYKRCHLDLISELAAIASRHHLLQLDYAALEELARAAA